MIVQLLYNVTFHVSEISADFSVCFGGFKDYNILWKHLPRRSLISLFFIL